MKSKLINSLILLVLIGVLNTFSPAQSGKRTRPTGDGASILNVVATRNNGSTEQIKAENLALYENGVQQEIKSFRIDPSPSRIVLLVDNSQTLRADVAKLQAAVKEFIYEIYEGDQLFVIAYDEKAEIIHEWSDDAKKLETSLETFRKKGQPFLFDALNITLEEVLRPLMPGTRKTAVVMIGDGLDKGSKIKFEDVLANLQRENVVVYAVQIPDRTGGAFRRDQPKPEETVTKLTGGTGGKIFPFDDPQTAAKGICDELRKNRYLLSYQPSGASYIEARRVFLIGDEGITVRTKNFQPPYK
jgi:Ca-activated chloride channel family protein